MDFWKRHKPDEERFSMNMTKDLQGDWYESVYLKVEEGKVIETGREIWGKRESVFLVGLPWIWSGLPQITAKASLVYPIGDCQIKVEVKLTIHLSDAEFNFQEIYDQIFKGGNKRIIHLAQWVAELYSQAAEQNEAVQQAFKNYYKSEQPAHFVNELAWALKSLPFPGKPLSNITKIEAEVEFNTVAAQLKATYQ